MEPCGYTIARAAQASGLSVKAIRYYEAIGLIPPARRRNSAARTGGSRVYGEDDIGRLRFVRHARILDLGLKDIRWLLAVAEQAGCASDAPEYEAVLGRHLREIDERIARLRGLRQQIENLMSRPRGGRPQSCSWTACDCLGPDALPPTASGPTAKRGGQHV